MKITGYKLKESIKLKILELNTVLSLFDESLHKFEDEQLVHPIEIGTRAQKLEREIVILQTMQDYYNVMIPINIQGIPNLAAGIKAVGGYGRRAKLFRSAATGAKTDRWDRGRNLTRKSDEIMAVPTMTKMEALEEAKRYEKLATGLRTAIALANSTEVEVPETIYGNIEEKDLFD